MKTTTLSTGGSSLPFIVLGVLAAGLVFATLTDRKVPLLGSDRSVLAALLILGMAICSQGIGRVAAAGAWTHPLSILGYLLGAAILVIGGAAFFGRPIPPLTSTNQTILAVGGLAVVKLVLSAIHHLLL